MPLWEIIQYAKHPVTQLEVKVRRLEAECIQEGVFGTPLESDLFEQFEELLSVALLAQLGFHEHQVHIQPVPIAFSDGTTGYRLVGGRAA